MKSGQSVSLPSNEEGHNSINVGAGCTSHTRAVKVTAPWKERAREQPHHRAHDWTSANTNQCDHVLNLTPENCGPAQCHVDFLGLTLDGW